MNRSHSQPASTGPLSSRSAACEAHGRSEAHGRRELNGQRELHGRQSPRIAIVGGGITGLSAAYFASQHPARPQVHLFEASSRVGGVIQTVDAAPHLIELGPDMFTTREPEALQLCQALGLDEHLIGTLTDRRGAYIVKRGKLIPIPSGMALMAPQRLSTILKSPLLSWRGRLRLLAEAFVRPRRETVDESLASFAQRRFGKEAYQWLIQPLVSGIYTADPIRLSMRATMHEFLEMEREHGSLIRATWRKRKVHPRDKSSAPRRDLSAAGARYGLFLSCDEGMELLIQRLQDQLAPSQVHLNSPVEAMERVSGDDGWQLKFAQLPTQKFDGVVLATRAFDAGRLVRPFASTLAETLNTIPYASTAVAVMIVPRAAIKHPIHAFGVVSPLAERRKIIAVSFASHKFPGRAPEDQVILRVFIGGACQPELLEQSDEDLLALAKTELGEVIGLEPDVQPIREQVVRWNRAMPQYVLGHFDRITRVEELAAEVPRLELAGNAYRGVGIPQCIRSARQAIDRLLGPAAEQDESAAEHPPAIAGSIKASS